MREIVVDRIQVGDVIVEGSKQMRVSKVEHDACTRRKVHINGTQCWDSGATVTIKN